MILFHFCCLLSDYLIKLYLYPQLITPLQSDEEYRSLYVTNPLPIAKIAYHDWLIDNGLYSERIVVANSLPQNEVILLTLFILKRHIPYTDLRIFSVLWMDSVILCAAFICVFYGTLSCYASVTQDCKAG